MQSHLRVLSLAFLACVVVDAGDSCCKATAAAASAGSRKVPDPFATQPEYWDEEDDGVWERPMVKESSLPLWYRVQGEVMNGAESASPWLLLGLFSAALLTAAQPSAATLQTWFGTGGNSVLSAVRGALLGLAIPLCSCGALPLAITLAAEGVPLSAIAAFVTSAQAAGIDSMLFTVGAFGVEVAAGRLAVAAILAITVGLVTMPSSTSSSSSSSSSSKPAASKSGCSDASSDCCDDKSDATAVAAAMPCCKPGDAADDDCCATAAADKPSLAQTSFGMRVVAAICNLFLEVVPWVGVGILFSAACNVLAPAGGLWQAGGGDSLMKRALLLGATVPVQLCEHGVVTVAAALAKQGVSAGTAFAFIVVGPATNTSLLMLIASLSAKVQQKENSGSGTAGGLFNTIGIVPKVVVIMVAFGLGLSYAVDAIAPYFPAVLAIADGGKGSGGGGGGFLPDWYIDFSPAGVAVLAATAVVRLLVAGGSGSGNQAAEVSERAEKKSQ